MISTDPTPSCDACGQPAAVVINGLPWCADCFHAMGSCCGEWHDDEDDRKICGELRGDQPTHPI